MNGFAITKKGIRLMLVGLIVLVAGFILLSGGGVKDPQVFNWDMFSFRRLVVAPVVMLAGVIIEIVAIMRHREDK